MIPERLKTARKKRHYTQELLAIKAGIDESTASSRISQYENGYSVPSYQLMQKIASILQIPTCYFYCDDEELADYLINYYCR